MKFYYYLYSLAGAKYINERQQISESIDKVGKLLNNRSTLSSHIWREIIIYLQIPMLLISEDSDHFEFVIRGRIDQVKEWLSFVEDPERQEVVLSLRKDIEHLLDQVRQQKVEYELYRTRIEVKAFMDKFILSTKEPKSVSKDTIDRTDWNGTEDQKAFMDKLIFSTTQPVPPSKDTTTFNRINWLGTKDQFQLLLDSLLSNQWILLPTDKDTLSKLIENHFTFPPKQKLDSLSSAPNPFERIPPLDFQNDRDQTIDRIVWYGKGIDLAEVFHQLETKGWIENILQPKKTGRAILKIFSISPQKDSSFFRTFSEVLKDERKKLFGRILSLDNK